MSELGLLELCPGKIHIIEGGQGKVCFLEIDVVENCTVEISLGKTCLGEVHVVQLHAGEVSSDEVAACEVRLFHGGLAEVAVSHQRTGEVRVGEVGLAEISTGKVHVGDGSLCQVSLAEIALVGYLHSIETCVLEVGLGELAIEKRGSIEVCAFEVCTFERCGTDVCTADRRSSEVCLFEVRTVNNGILEGDFGEVRFFEVRCVTGRALEISNAFDGPSLLELEVVDTLVAEGSVQVFTLEILCGHVEREGAKEAETKFIDVLHIHKNSLC